MNPDPALCLKIPLPRIEGAPIQVRFSSALTASRGKLLSGKNAGSPVHAGTFLRKRRIVLDTNLLEDSAELARIWVHELFHFVWRRLGNPTRRSFEEVIAQEIRSKIPGELGWSSELRKRALHREDPIRRTRRWREYVCESFCDTAAWLFAGLDRHDEFRLLARARKRRRDWFEQSGVKAGIRV